MSKIIFPLIFFFYINSLLSQSFITVDNDTNEFIEDVNYSLFFKKKQVFYGKTENKKITSINNEIEYDSISLSRIDYYTLGLAKEKLDSIVYLTKKIVYLNEVVVNPKKNEYLLLGETNRFIKKQSRVLTKDMNFGILYKNENDKAIEIKKITFFIEKNIFRTAYKINFFEASETIPVRGNQYVDIGNLIHTTDTLYIEKKHKNIIEIDIYSELTIKPRSSIFVTIQLLNYYDENDKIIIPSKYDLTKLKFQISNKLNYYSKTIDLFTKEMSDNLMNINLMINYDFANKFFLKPHKSILVSPAIILYVKEYKN